MESKLDLEKRKEWKKDSVYKAWEQRLYVEKWNFAKTLEELKVKSWLPECLDHKMFGKLSTEKIRVNWSDCVRQWNEVEKIPCPKSDKDLVTKGFAAIVFFFACLPIEDLEDKVIQRVFTQFDMRIINFARHYNSLPLIKDWQGTQSDEALFHDAPLFPGVVCQSEYRDNRYNRTAWWICYRAYEKSNGFKQSIVSSESTSRMKEGHTQEPSQQVAYTFKNSLVGRADL